MNSMDIDDTSESVAKGHAGVTNPHPDRRSDDIENNIALRENAIMDSEAINRIRETLITARESAMLLREDSVTAREGSATSREDSATSREDSATSREDSATSREDSATLREQGTRTADMAKALSNDQMVKLRQVNERLIIATIEAQKLAEQLQLAKDLLEHAKNTAEKASLAKTEFLSNMSHELRTPLNAILGFSQLLESGKPEPTSSQMIRLSQITKAGWYLLELINEILDLAVIESGKLSLSQDPVTLSEILQECQMMVETQALEHGIKVIFHPLEHTCIADADRTRVKQVLLNLISNAIKYNRKDGTVEVICALMPTQRMRISIKDSGRGLSPKQQAQLFQPFNRLGQEKSGEQGTGIGLVVSKKLVELMGGTIGVDSTPGTGSTFWFELLQHVSPQPVADDPPPLLLLENTQNNAKMRTLLYMEDNPANLTLVGQIIKEYPHLRMLSAADGSEGIALAYANLLDVILMDISMPGADNFHVLNVLRKDPATAKIPVIALSANTTPQDIQKGLDAGFFRYITKPIQVHEFKHALLDALIFSAKEHLKINETGHTP